MSSLLKRLLIFPPALLLVHFLGFAYAHLVRPLRAARNPFLATSPEQPPLLEAYGGYLNQVLQGDLGRLSSGGFGLPADIGAAIAQTSLASLGLLGLALVIAAGFGVVLGVTAAQAQPPTIRRWLTTLSTMGLAMPTFFIGALFFSGWFLFAKWSPPGTALPIPLLGFGWDAHLIMPVLVMTIRPMVQVAQLTSGLLVEEFTEQYVVTARSLGRTWRKIRYRDALRNIYAPVILAIAGSLRLVVGELIIVEWLFEWPGIGRLLAETLIPSGLAFTSGAGGESELFLSPAVVAAVLVVFATLFIVVDLIASSLAQAADPRLREV